MDLAGQLSVTVMFVEDKVPQCPERREVMVPEVEVRFCFVYMRSDMIASHGSTP